MDLQPYVDGVRHELGVAAAAGGADAQALAERLTAPLDSAIRLALLEALSDAASEITRELAPGSVDVRLRGREPEFVVSRGRRRRARTRSRDAGVRRRQRHVAGDAPPAGKPAVSGRRGRSGGKSFGERVAGPRGRIGPRRQASDARRFRQAIQRLGPLTTRIQHRRTPCRHSPHPSRSRPPSRSSADLSI